MAREEWVSYHQAWERDPFLPAALLPKAYLGTTVQTQHEELRHELWLRLTRLATA